MQHERWGCWASPLVVATMLSGVACGDDGPPSAGSGEADTTTAPGTTDGSGATASADDSTTTGMAPTGVDPSTGGSSTSTTGPGEDCAEVELPATVERQPADILVVLDNSGSMMAEAGLLEMDLGPFVDDLAAAAIDVRVALISASSIDATGVCIPDPLGSGACPDDDNPPSFLHVVDSVGSSNALQLVLDLHPQWSTITRPEAATHVLVISDDDSDLAANAFDVAFRALDPNFEDYVFHAIASPEDPLAACLAATTCCPGSMPLVFGLGQEYLDLTALTGGVFGDLCQQDFGPSFTAIATLMDAGAGSVCAYEIPMPPEGTEFDPNQLGVSLDDGAGRTTLVPRVEGARACSEEGGWHYDDPARPSVIVMCPQTCAEIGGLVMGTIVVAFDCPTA